jgi:tetratricopeptide (TPR) repeat protein
MEHFRVHGTARTVWWLIFVIGASVYGAASREARAQLPPAVPTIGPIHLSSQPEIDAGFRLLYELKFPQARGVFQDWGTRHRGEALGPAAEAAGYLFQIFDQQGVLTSDFFLDDKRLLGGIEGTPDRGMRDSFEAAVRKSQDLAHAELKSDPQNADALFALTMATGMLADYSSLIEKRQIESLRLTREADNVAKNLLAVAPSAADAYVALGAANYILGCLPAYKRFLIRFGGFHGDRELGMQQLGLTAAHGHYLRPYAKLTLGLAAMREKQWDLAQEQFEQLVAEFPGNAKFARELAKLRARIPVIGPETVKGTR